MRIGGELDSAFENQYPGPSTASKSDREDDPEEGRCEPMHVIDIVRSAVCHYKLLSQAISGVHVVRIQCGAPSSGRRNSEIYSAASLQHPCQRSGVWQFTDEELELRVEPEPVNPAAAGRLNN